MKKNNIRRAPKGRAATAPAAALTQPPRPKTSDVNRREKSSGIVLTAAIIATVLALNVLLYVIVSVFGLYLKPREKDVTTLSGVTDTLFADAIEANKKVRITFFYYLNKESDVTEHSLGRYVHRSVKNFEERYEGFISVDYVNLVTRYSELEDKRISLEKYESTDVPLGRYSVAFECGDKLRVVTDLVSESAYSDFFTLDESLAATSYDGEQYIAGMICAVTREESKKAYITASHSEKLDPAFGRLLTLAGYEFDPKGFDMSKSVVPEDCDLLIISNPTTDFVSGSAESEIERLKFYIENGGNVMVSLDPFAKRLSALEGMLESYGIAVSRSTLSDGRVVSDIVREDGVFGAGGAAVGSTDGYTFAATFASAGGISSQIASKVKENTSDSVVVSTAGALNLSGDAKAILTSSRTSHCEVDGETTRDGGSFPVAAISTRTSKINGKEAKIIVTSGIYSTASAYLTSNGYANRDYYYAILECAFGAQMLPYGFDMELIEDTPTIAGLTMGMAKFYFALSMLIPVTAAVVGTVIVIRRKNR